MNQNTASVGGGLRQARKQQAAKRTPAKVTQLRTDTDQATSRNAAKPQSSKRATLKWTLSGDAKGRKQVPATAVAPNGDLYSIAGSDKQWRADVIDVNKNKSTLVVDVAFDKAYKACVEHSKSP